VTDYLVVVEGSDGSFSAFSPDLPGCAAAADSREEVERLIREAIPLHIESLKEHSEPVPEPQSSVLFVPV